MPSGETCARSRLPWLLASTTSFESRHSGLLTASRNLRYKPGHPYKVAPALLLTAGGLAQEVLAPMQAKRNPLPAEDDARDDWGVLVLLVGQDQRPWSVAEIIREREDKIATLDSLDRLRKSGLIHRTADGLVFPTRAALHYTQIRV